MDKKSELIVVGLALVGGVLVASGMHAHVAVVEEIGIPLDKQAYAGGVLLVIAVALHLVKGGRWLPWMK